MFSREERSPFQTWITFVSCATAYFLFRKKLSTGQIQRSYFISFKGKNQAIKLSTNNRAPVEILFLKGQARKSRTRRKRRNRAVPSERQRAFYQKTFGVSIRFPLALRANIRLTAKILGCIIRCSKEKISDGLENVSSSCPQKKKKARLPGKEQEGAGQKSAEEAQGDRKEKTFRLARVFCAQGT